MTRETIAIRATRAIDDPGLRARFVEQHTDVLHGIGVAGVVASDGAWHDDPSTVLVCAHHDQLGLVGGMRIVSARAGDLPMQLALATRRHQLDTAFAGIDAGSNAEIGGLWSAPRYAGRGLGRLLIESTVVVARLVGLRTLTCLASPSTAPICRALGFVALRVGDDESLPYPHSGMQSWAMAQRDLSTLRGADPVARLRVLDLCARPRRARLEHRRTTDLEVHYDLIFGTRVAITPVA